MTVKRFMKKLAAFQKLHGHKPTRATVGKETYRQLCCEELSESDRLRLDGIETTQHNQSEDKILFDFTI